jgi:NitT/TauT family transport system permease protein
MTRQPRRALGTGRTATVVLPVLGFLLFIALWWAAVVVFSIPSYELPTPQSVLSAFWDMPGDLMKDAGVSLLEVLLGFVLAVLVAAIIALLVHASPIVEKTLYPMVLAFNAVPKVAVAPLAVIWLGFNLAPKVLVIFMICFFPIVISSVSGLASAPPELIDLAHSLEARPLSAFVKIRLPNALPQVFVGLKVAMTLAVIGAVVAEFQGGSTAGLGFLIYQVNGQGETALAFAAVALLTVMSVVLYYTLAGLERLLLPWASAVRRERTA